MVASREIRLKSRPIGVPSADNFELASVSVPNPASGEVQVQNLWMTVDPYMRGRMIDRASYVPPFKLGEALQGGAIGEVTASNDHRLKPRTLLGVLIVTILDDGLNLLGVNQYLQMIIKGTVVIAAVLASQDRSKVIIVK